MNQTIPIILAGAYLLTRKTGPVSFSGYDKVLKWKNIAANWGETYNIPTEIILAIIAGESSGENISDFGPANEIGLMQVTPTGLTYAGTGYNIVELKDASKNIQTGCAHLAKDVNLFSYETPISELSSLTKIQLAIMAYNIKREHLYETPITDEQLQKVQIGLNYLKKIERHRKNILPLLLGSNG